MLTTDGGAHLEPAEDLEGQIIQILDAHPEGCAITLWFSA